MVAAEIVASIALVAILIAGPGAGISQADDLTQSQHLNYVAGTEGQGNNRDTAGSPLLPCPQSIPCLPLASYGEAPRPSAAIASKGLLPCPFSVPCFTTGPASDHIGERPASLHATYPALRRGAHKSRPGTHARARQAKIRTRITVERMNLAGSRSGASARIAPPGDMALRGDITYEQRARMLLQTAEQKLGRVDPTRLRPNQSQQYAKASDLTRAGVKALQAKDNLAALAFAEKAQILIAGL